MNIDPRKKTVNELYTLIREWAEDRNIIKGATVKDQALKLNSEFGELLFNTWNNIHFHESPEVSYSYQDAIKDDIGDNLVVLTIIAAQLGYRIEDIDPDSLQRFDHVSTGGVLMLGATYGKLSDAILKGNEEDSVNLISTAKTILSEIATGHQTSLLSCLEVAYEEIKDRKGVMYHGAFVKESDDNYERILKEIEESK